MNMIGNGTRRNIELLRQLRNGVSALRVFVQQRLAFCRCQTATYATMPPFCHLVIHILLVCAEPQVGGIHALRVVALVEHLQPRRDWPAR